MTWKFGFSTNTQNWQYWQHCQLCILIYLRFVSLFAPYNISKCEIRWQWVHEDCISGLKNSLVLFISNGTAKTKLAILAFLCCAEFMKNYCDWATVVVHKKKSSWERSHTQGAYLVSLQIYSGIEPFPKVALNSYSNFLNVGGSMNQPLAKHCQKLKTMNEGSVVFLLFMLQLGFPVKPISCTTFMEMRLLLSSLVPGPLNQCQSQKEQI